MTYRYRRDAVRLPDAQLHHITLRLAFYESHVDGAALLFLTAREPLTALRLDARDLEIFEVAVSLAETLSPNDRERFAEPFPPTDGFSACAHTLDTVARKLVIPLPRPLAPGASLRVYVRCRCVPSDALLEGLYRDVTPPGAPQQYISQCQHARAYRPAPPPFRGRASGGLSGRGSVTWAEPSMKHRQDVRATAETKQKLLTDPQGHQHV